MSVGIFPGKFQPFHNGHMMVVKGMAKSCDRLIVAVCHGEGMAADDLFSVEEIREMVSAALLDEDILDAEIHVVKDSPQDSEWVDKLVELAEGKEVQIWSGREHILAVCEDAGVNTKKIVHVPGHEGEAIRQQIKTGEREWTSKVPTVVADIVRRHYK